jgi:hypothetical protein
VTAAANPELGGVAACDGLRDAAHIGDGVARVEERDAETSDRLHLFIGCGLGHAASIALA